MKKNYFLLLTCPACLLSLYNAEKMDDQTLQKYLRNELSEKELVEVLDWLDASPENQRHLDSLD